VKYRLIEDRDLVGSGATRGASSSRNSEVTQSDDSSSETESIFQARGEILEGPREIPKRVRAHIAVKLFSDGARPHNIAEPVKRPPTRREDIFRPLGGLAVAKRRSL
jgi:hypothetical protein